MRTRKWIGQPPLPAIALEGPLVLVNPGRMQRPYPSRECGAIPHGISGPQCHFWLWCRMFKNFGAGLCKFLPL